MLNMMLNIDWPPNNEVVIKLGVPGRVIPGMEQETDSSEIDTDDGADSPPLHCGRRHLDDRDDQPGGDGNTGGNCGGGILAN